MYRCMLDGFYDNGGNFPLTLVFQHVNLNHHASRGFQAYQNAWSIYNILNQIDLYAFRPRWLLSQSFQFAYHKGGHILQLAKHESFPDECRNICELFKVANEAALDFKHMQTHTQGHIAHNLYTMHYLFILYAPYSIIRIVTNFDLIIM